MPARFLSMREVADELRMSESALYRKRNGDRLVFDGGQELPLIRIGRRIRVPAIALDRLVERMLEEAAAS